MHFDDRLDTVLKLPNMGKTFARIQYRQLLDILGSGEGETESAWTDAAYRKLTELSETIPAGERASMLHTALTRLRSPRLLAFLAEGEPAVASAAIALAQISDDDWLALIPSLPVRARGILRHRRELSPKVEALLEQLGVTDRGLPPAHVPVWPAPGADGREEPLVLDDLVEIDSPLEELEEAEDAIEPAGTGAQGADYKGDIATLRRRIEAFSKARRQARDHESEAPRLPLGDQEETLAKLAAQFDFDTDPVGRITWASEGIAPMVVGMRLGAMGSDGALAAPAEAMAAMRRRQPLVNVPVSICGAPAVSGEWQIHAAPRFDPQMGGFTGYSGRFRRPAPASQSEGAAPETDRIRQIVHELRTPANAIQISAEIIQQNLFGQTPHEYRAIAAMIASDTAYVLAGFDELERLAKLEAGATEMQAGSSDLAKAIGTVVEQLQAYSAKRDSGFFFDPASGPLEVALAGAEVERLVWRLLATLTSETAPGERLAISCAMKDACAEILMELPEALAERDEDALFKAEASASTLPRALSTGMFGTGFSLRLARAEARAAGGSLKPTGKYLTLLLPPTNEHPLVAKQA